MTLINSEPTNVIIDATHRFTESGLPENTPALAEEAVVLNFFKLTRSSRERAAREYAELARALERHFARTGAQPPDGDHSA